MACDFSTRYYLTSFPVGEENWKPSILHSPGRMSHGILTGKLDETCQRQEQDIIHLKRALKEREEGPRIHRGVCPRMGQIIPGNSNFEWQNVGTLCSYNFDPLHSHPGWWVVKFAPLAPRLTFISLAQKKCKQWRGIPIKTDLETAHLTAGFRVLTCLCHPM